MQNLPYTPFLQEVAVRPHLRSFVRDVLGRRCAGPWDLHALEAGGGGDCLFHSIAAGLEHMLQLDPAAAQHVLQHFAMEDACKKKPFMVKKLRSFVAERTAQLPPETLLNFIVRFADEERLGLWHDHWPVQPGALLQQCGFGILDGAETVEAVGASADGTTHDIVVTYRQHSQLSMESVPNGMAKLTGLRALIKEIYQLTGEYHWGTETDIAMLSEALGIGFIILTSVEQGNRQWIKGLSFERADYPFWMFLYREEPQGNHGDNAHYRLASLQCDDDEPRSFRATDRLPPTLAQHFNQCNASTPIGSRYQGGVV